MKLTREEVLELALKLEVKPILYTDVINDVQMCRDDLWLLTTEQLINFCSDHLDKPLAESAVAPGECGSVPDERAKFEAWARPAGFDNLILSGDDYFWPPAHYAWKAWQARAALGMQPPNTVERELALAQVGEFAGQAGQAHLSALIDDLRPDAERFRFLVNQDIENNFPRAGLFIGQIPENYALTGPEAIAEIDKAMNAAKSGISSPPSRPNEQKSYVGNFGDTGEAQLRRELANVPLPNYMEGK